MDFIEQLLSRNELTPAQIDLFYRYRDEGDFMAILSSYFYYEIPHLLDFYLLKEKEIGALSPFFKETLQQWQLNTQKAQTIKAAFEKAVPLPDLITDSKGKALCNADNLKTIYQLCLALSKRERDADLMLLYFFEYLKKAKKHLVEKKLSSGLSLYEKLDQFPSDWYSEPWYYIYVQYFGTDEKEQGNFDQLTKMLDYLESLGIQNIYILPHYESPNGDAGYDISDYKPAKAYGGEAAFRRFMKAALNRGFRIATDLVFNHCSVEHPWFQAAVNGESKYFNYFLKCPAYWDDLEISKILKDEAGDLYLYLPEKDEKGQPVISKRILIFPDVDQSLWLKKEVEKLQKPVLFYREFYPFQVDMDIQEPAVLKELFSFLAEEISIGVLGKRTDAIAHWVKKPGTEAKNLPATYALQQLIKQFLKHIHPNTIILPEVVTTSRNLKSYAGTSCVINGRLTSSGGDALLDFQQQAMLREMLYFQKTKPLWTQVFDLGPNLDNTAVALIPNEHHDETYMGFIQEIEAMREFLESEYQFIDKNGQAQTINRGIIYKNGMSAGARYADALGRDKRKIANAFFCLYMMPGTPVIYYGSEIGASNNWKQMHKRQKDQYETFLALLGPEIVGPGKALNMEKCKDPRELQRGPIPARRFYKKLQKGDPVLQLIKELNALRSEYTALRSIYLEFVDTYNESILGMIKYPEPGTKGSPFLVLSNLSEQSLIAKIPFQQLLRKSGISSLNLIERFQNIAEEGKIHCHRNNYEFKPHETVYIELALNPFSAILFEIQTP